MVKVENILTPTFFSGILVGVLVAALGTYLFETSDINDSSLIDNQCYETFRDNELILNAQLNALTPEQQQEQAFGYLSAYVINESNFIHCRNADEVGG